MSTKRKHRDSRTIVEADERLLESYPVVPGAKPRAYCPPACTSCTHLRPAGTNYTRTNGTETRENTPREMIITRACKCHFCGATWTDYAIVKHKI